MWPKRTEAEDVLANTTIDQIVAKQIGQDTPLPSLEVATEDFTGYVGALLARVQLRLPEHDFVELADDAAADGNQPARGVRAAVRPGGHGGQSRDAHEAAEAACSTRFPKEAADLQNVLGVARPRRASASISTTSARSNAASREPRRTARRR